jgi:hypothetical protein
MNNGELHAGARSGNNTLLKFVKEFKATPRNLAILLLDRCDIDIARHETDRELRNRAVFWLGQSRDPRAVQALLEIIDQ